MERMIGVCSKVFWAFEMHRQTKAMGISKAERKSVSQGKPVECLRRKVTVCSIQRKVTDAWLAEDSSFDHMNGVINASFNLLSIG